MRHSKLLLCLAFVVSVTAFAGFKSGWALTIGSSYAYGDFASVRGSSNGSAEIGCQVQAMPGSSNAVCFAYDGTSYVTCSSSDPAIVAVVNGINSATGGLEFFWDSSGHCSMVDYSHSSIFAPTTP